MAQSRAVAACDNAARLRILRSTSWTSSKHVSTWSSNRSAPGRCSTRTCSTCCSRSGARSSCRRRTGCGVRRSRDPATSRRRTCGRRKWRRASCRIWPSSPARSAPRSAPERISCGAARRDGRAGHERGDRPQLAALAQSRLVQSGAGAVEVEVGDGARGWGDLTYDAIVLTGSTPMLPERFTQQLNPGGRVFAVVGAAPVMSARLVRWVAPRELATRTLFETVLPPLLNAAVPAHFEFQVSASFAPSPTPSSSRAPPRWPSPSRVPTGRRARASWPEALPRPGPRAARAWCWSRRTWPRGPSPAATAGSWPGRDSAPPAGLRAPRATRLRLLPPGICGFSVRP